MRRAERAHRTVKRVVDEPNLEAALATTLEQLTATRRELFQQGYFPGDQQRMF